MIRSPRSRPALPGLRHHVPMLSLAGLLAAGCVSPSEAVLARATQGRCEVALDDVPTHERYDVPVVRIDLPGPDADVLLDLLRCCVPSRSAAALGLGGWSLSIGGVDADDRCALVVTTDLEGGGSTFECLAEDPHTWPGWTDEDVPPLGALREHCEVVATWSAL